MRAFRWARASVLDGLWTDMLAGIGVTEDRAA